MTKLLITYHLLTKSQEDETAVVVTMTDDKALELLQHQDRSRLISGPGYRKGLLATLLDRLAKLQGYAYGQFRTAQIIKVQYEEENP